MHIDKLLKEQMQIKDSFDSQFQKTVKNILLNGGSRQQMQSEIKRITEPKVKQSLNLGVRWINENSP